MTKRFFTAELDTLREQLKTMGEHAINQLKMAIKALVRQDKELARIVCEQDDLLDRMEVQLDEEAIRYLTLRGPVATDLRLALVGMKAGQNLERVGDEATNIARRAMVLADKPPLKEYVDIPRMADMAVEMLHDAIKAFENEDKALAYQILKRDREVDAIDAKLYSELSTYIANDPDTISVVVELMFISRSLERAADHATNIAEEVIFLLGGEIVRHSDLKS